MRCTRVSQTSREERSSFMARTLTQQELEWAKRAKRKSRQYPVDRKTIEAILVRQNGRCYLSRAKLIFDKSLGTPSRGRGCHPLYASLDHITPGGTEVQVVCYALNDLKGHLPRDVFDELKNQPSWKRLMRRWRGLAKRNSSRADFKKLLRS